MHDTLMINNYLTKIWHMNMIEYEQRGKQPENGQSGEEATPNSVTKTFWMALGDI